MFSRPLSLTLDRHITAPSDVVRADLSTAGRKLDQGVKIARLFENTLSKLLRETVEHDEFGIHQPCAVEWASCSTGRVSKGKTETSGVRASID
jgi:hypothetical protein